MNKVILIGRVTKDTGINNHNKWSKCCKNTIAVNRKFRNADGRI